MRRILNQRLRRRGRRRKEEGERSKCEGYMYLEYIVTRLDGEAF